MPPSAGITPGKNTIRILLTTDNHVGYLDSDPIRGDDSWTTFDEILSLARIHDADMIVQGGDLFHVSRPSKKAVFHVVRSLRAHTLGDRPCELQLLSDPAPVLRTSDTVNYEDPNLNVAVPMFAISGNHDDATGDGLLAPLDVLAATGLVNYFGLAPTQDVLVVAPLVFQKGTTRLALYGINNVRDERLHRLMRSGNVSFQKPADPDFFHLLCIHQNHHRRTVTSYVPEDFLPLFLNFVFWGHEHECVPFPQYNPATGFDTLQAGSSVATSLSDGEAAQKHVFLLDVCGTKYGLTALPLRTVRPFVMADVSLRAEGFAPGPASKADISALLLEKVSNLIADARDRSRAAGGPSDLLPLVRLRVDRSGDYDVENSLRFLNRFVGKVANVKDIVHYYTRKTADRQPSTSAIDATTATADEPVQKVTIQHLLKEHLGQSALHLVPEDGMLDMTRRFIEQDDRLIFQDFVVQTVDRATEQLRTANVSAGELADGATKGAFKELLAKLKQDGPEAGQDVGAGMEVGHDVGSEAATSKTRTATRPENLRQRSQRSHAKSKAMVDSDLDGCGGSEVVIVSDELEQDYNESEESNTPPRRKPSRKAVKKEPAVSVANYHKRGAKPQVEVLDDLLSLG